MHHAFLYKCLYIHVAENNMHESTVSEIRIYKN